MESNERNEMRYTTKKIAECFPHKTAEWNQRTTDDLNSVHSHVDALAAEGASREDAWAETIRLMGEQRAAARK